MTYIYNNLTEAPEYFPSLAFLETTPLGAWYDVSDINSMFQSSAGTTPAVVDSPVGYLRDKSGNGNHLIQATAGRRPTLRRDTDGKLYLEFDGVDDFLSGGPAPAQPFTRLTSLRVLSYVASDHVWGNASAGLAMSQSTGAAGNKTLSALAGGAQPGQFNSGMNEDSILTEIANGASSRTGVGRDVLTTYNLGTATQSAMILGSRTSAGSQYANFRFYGAVIIAGVVDFETRNKFVDFLSNRIATTQPTKLIVCYGDSITFGAVATGANSWINRLQSSAGFGDSVRLVNLGISSQKSDNIAARADAISVTIAFPGNEIPASGAATVTITAPTPRGSTVLDGPLSSTSAAVRAAYVEALDGSEVHGVFQSAGSGVYQFVRGQDGVAIPVAANAPLHIDVMDRDLDPDNIFIIWAGRNNLEESRVFSDITAMVDRLTTVTDKFIVIHPMNSRAETSGSAAHTARVVLDGQIAAAWPDNHIDMVEWLQDASASGPFVTLGYTRSAQDDIDIAADVPPNTWMGDAVHPNNDGHLAVMTKLKAFITDKGWV